MTTKGFVIVSLVSLFLVILMTQLKYDSRHLS